MILPMHKRGAYARANVTVHTFPCCPRNGFGVVWVASRLCHSKIGTRRRRRRLCARAYSSLWSCVSGTFSPARRSEQPQSNRILFAASRCSCCCVGVASRALWLAFGVRRVSDDKRLQEFQRRVIAEPFKAHDATTDCACTQLAWLRCTLVQGKTTWFVAHLTARVTGAAAQRRTALSGAATALRRSSRMEQ